MFSIKKDHIFQGLTWKSVNPESFDTSEAPTNIVRRILEVARWAPSGDNVQPWRFTLTSETSFIARLIPKDKSDIYNIDGMPELLSFGTLLENVSIAAAEYGYKANMTPVPPAGNDRYSVHIVLEKITDLKRDPLFPFIFLRSVQRGRMKRTPLSLAELHILKKELPQGMELLWISRGSRYWHKMLHLVTEATDIRLRIPETYAIHSQITDFEHKYSPDRIPSRAMGLSLPTLFIMKWAMKSWARMCFINKYLGATMTARLEMDIIPAIFSAGYFALAAHNPLKTPEEIIQAGRAIQRVWLRATQMGLQIQPEMATYIFATYGRRREGFTTDSTMLKKAQALSLDYADLHGHNAEKIFWVARLGKGRAQTSRSTRYSLDVLIN